LLLMTLAFSRSLLENVLLLSIGTMIFYLPGKYYTFQVASSDQYWFPQLNFGLFESYGLNSADILSVWVMILSIGTLVFNWNLIITRFTSLGSGTQKAVVWGVASFVTWILYIFWAFLSANQISFNSVFSGMLLIQQLKMPVVFGSLFLLLVKHSSLPATLKHLVTAMIFFEVIIGLTQAVQITTITTQTNQQLPLEESMLIRRPTGTFFHSNQYAFVLLLLLLVSINTDNTSWRVPTLLLAVFGIVLSQSRVVWLLLVVWIGLEFWRWRWHGTPLFKEVLEWLVQRPRLSAYLAASVVAATIIVIPRLVGSIHFFSEFGGGTLRLQMLKEGLLVLQQAPLLGFGLGTNVYQMFKLFPDGYISFFPFAIHNAFLQNSIEVGVVGMLLFFLPVYFLLRQSSLFGPSFYSWFAAMSILGYYSFHPASGHFEYGFVGLVLMTCWLRLAYDKEIK